MREYLEQWMNGITPWIFGHGIKIVAVILIGYVLHRFSQRMIERAVRATIVPEKGMSAIAETKREDTLIRIFAGAAQIAILIIVLLMVLQEMGLMIAPILAGAGIAGLALGFGGQYLIRDIISGLFIILENQYRIGDVVSFDGTGGLVEDISLRMTTIRDLDGTVHHIPHGEIKKVSNLSKYFSRVNINIGIAYHSNLEHVIKVVNQVGREIAEDVNWKSFIIQAPQFLRIDSFENSAITIKILGETLPIKQWDVAGELRKRLKIAFDKEGIEIPFPQRVIHFNDKKEVKHEV